ncbi:MAG: MarR family transcriptional regulator [Sphingomonadaceae bacterium]|nr:MarR family transcriptional regulator [Sphingomonadaceae bacterium]
MTGLADIAALGARCLAAVPLRAAAARLDSAALPDLVVAELDALAVAEAGAAALDALFGRLRDGVGSNRFGAVVIIPPSLVDLGAALLDCPEIELLVAPEAGERQAALATALPAPRALRVADSGTDSVAVRLGQMRDEVGRIAQRLAALAGVAAQPLPDRAPEDGEDAPVDAGLVRSIIRARRLRDAYFTADLFADPAWDMLLDLTAARMEGGDVAVSSLCIAAAVPPTTALRWIKLLSDTGLIVRRADPADRRRIFIALADAAADAMLRYLAAMQRCGVAVV